jgi:hypothetical protein
MKQKHCGTRSTVVEMFWEVPEVFVCQGDECVLDMNLNINVCENNGF